MNSNLPVARSYQAKINTFQRDRQRLDNVFPSPRPLSLLPARIECAALRAGCALFFVRFAYGNRVAASSSGFQRGRRFSCEHFAGSLAPRAALIRGLSFWDEPRAY